MQTINVCGVIVINENYPVYLDFFKDPNNTINLEGNYSTVKKYFHNSTDTCMSFDVS